MLKNTRLATRKQARLRIVRLIALLLPVLAISCLSGCKSKPEPDHRPSWVQQAEARLQRPPSWQVSGSGVNSESGSEARSGFFGSGQRATTATASSSAQEKGTPQSEAAASAPRKRVAHPPGVEWSKTQITVSVEE